MWGCLYVHLNIHLLWGCLYGHVWVGGGMVIACHVMPPHTEVSWQPASRFWYPPHCHWGTYTSFQKVIVFGRLQAEVPQSLHDWYYCANVAAASSARADLLDLVPPCRAERGASCAWPTVRHTSRRGLDHKNWIFWIWPLSFHHQNYWMTKLSGFITMHKWTKHQSMYYSL